MSDDVRTAELGQRLAALLRSRPRRFGSPGRRAVEDRTVLAGLVWVLHHDVPGR